MLTHIVDNLIKELNTNNLKLTDILKNLFQNTEIKHRHVNDIRRNTIIWQMTNEILKKCWSTERCKILAIWDIEYFWDLKIKWEKIIKNALSKVDPKNLVWYDLNAQGSHNLRKILVDYMDIYYNLNLLNKSIINDIIPSYWGIDWFVTILETIKTLHKDQKINFIYPEASFVASIKIAENILWKDNLIQILKPSKNNFFITTKQIKNLNLKKENINIYYITPVWNPTGQKIDSKIFNNLIKNISKEKNSIIILDNVYMGILHNKISKEMFDKVFLNSKIMNKIIFVESLSKTLWTTWFRFGWIWTFNDIFASELKRNTILKKAWFSKILNEFVINLLSNLDEIKKFQDQTYNFWSSQRLNFFKFIKLKHSDLFDFNLSPKISSREWIYILLKVKEWFSIEDIFAKTWIIGVWINLSDWLYIRYAFWNINYY